MVSPAKKRSILAAWIFLPSSQLNTVTKSTLHLSWQVPSCAHDDKTYYSFRSNPFQACVCLLSLEACPYLFVFCSDWNCTKPLISKGSRITVVGTNYTWGATIEYKCPVGWRTIEPVATCLGPEWSNKYNPWCRGEFCSTTHSSSLIERLQFCRSVSLVVLYTLAFYKVYNAGGSSSRVSHMCAPIGSPA